MILYTQFMLLNINAINSLIKSYFNELGNFKMVKLYH